MPPGEGSHVPASNLRVNEHEPDENKSENEQFIE